MAQHRGFIWRTERPRSCDSYFLMIQQRIVALIYFIQTLQRKSVDCFLMAWPFFFSKGWCHWEDPCLSEEALYRGAVAAQAAHSCCPLYSFLLLGHNPPFFSHWKFASTLGIILTRYLVEKFCKKKNIWRHGRLWRPMLISIKST